MKQRFDRTTIPKILTIAALGCLAVLLVIIFIMGLRRVTITGTVTSTWETHDSEDGTTYHAEAVGEYQGKSRYFTVASSHNMSYGNTVKGKIFPNESDQGRYDRLWELTLMPTFLGFCFMLWWIFAWVSLSNKRRKRLNDIRMSAAAAAESPDEAFDKPEAVPPHVADAWAIIAQRGLATHDIAAGLTEEEWDMPEMKANILRPDVSAIESLLAQNSQQLLSVFCEKIYKNQKFSEFRNKIPEPINIRCSYEWLNYKIGPDADTCSVRVSCWGRFANSAYEFMCIYDNDGTLPTDLSVPVNLKLTKVVSESFGIPDSGD